VKGKAKEQVKGNYVFEATYLEVYHYSKDEDGSQEVHQVGQVLTVESLTETSDFVLTSGKQVEESNDGSLKLCSTSSVDRSRRECFPDDGLADVGSNEE
jgi:hypothetical protein